MESADATGNEPERHLSRRTQGYTRTTDARFAFRQPADFLEVWAMALIAAMRGQARGFLFFSAGEVQMLFLEPSSNPIVVWNPTTGPQLYGFQPRVH